MISPAPPCSGLFECSTQYIVVNTVLPVHTSPYLLWKEPEAVGIVNDQEMTLPDDSGSTVSGKKGMPSLAFD